MTLAEYESSGQRQQCQRCEGALRRLFTPCSLKTTTRFMSGSSDGLPDDASRRIAYAKAREAGVSVSGKKFHPGLCRKGMAFDPQAWYGDEVEAKRKALSLGRSVEGSINATGPTFDADLAALEKPYRVARHIVKDDVNREIKQVHGGKVSKEKREELYRHFQDKHSGTTQQRSTLAP